MRIPPAAEAQLKGRPGAVTSAAAAPRPAGRREQPRAATPCPNTMAARARQEIHQTKIKKGMAYLHWDSGYPRIVPFKQVWPERINYCFVGCRAIGSVPGRSAHKPLPPFAQT